MNKNQVSKFNMFLKSVLETSQDAQLDVVEGSSMSSAEYYKSFNAECLSIQRFVSSSEDMTLLKIKSKIEEVLTEELGHAKWQWDETQDAASTGRCAALTYSLNYLKEFTDRA